MGKEGEGVITEIEQNDNNSHGDDAVVGSNDRYASDFGFMRQGEAGYVCCAFRQSTGLKAQCDE